jgi:hypothetical protein
MKKIAEIGFTMLGIYLIVSALSYHAGLFFSLSSDAGFVDYFLRFGPSSILLVGGVLCILLRSHFSGWVLKWQDIEIPKEIDINRIECVLLSLLGALVLLQTIPYSALMIIHFLSSPTVQKTEFGDIPMKSYAFVQAVAVLFELVVVFSLLFFPQKVQKILHKTRGF